MRMKQVLLSTAATLAVALMTSGLGPVAARAEAGLSGQVTGDGPMEGVLVTAKKNGSTIAYTVVSDAQGHYGFPAGKIEGGEYTLRIRATGFDLDGANRDGALKATVDPQKPTTADLKLKKTRNLPAQLVNAEWMMSMPGTEDQKAQLLNCVGCHTLERIVRSNHDANEFTQVVYRMANYAQVSQPIKPQKRMDPEWAPKPEAFRKFAEFLATINLSEVDKWEYALKTLPRPTGRDTKVLITEYDLPRPTIEPHDVILDNKGTVWYSNFGEMFLGKMDPKTGAHSEIALPQFKPGFPVGTLDLEIDKAGDMWIGMMFQGAIAKFDPKYEKFSFYPIPKEQSNNVTQLNMMGLEHGVDGKIWTNNAGNQELYRIDLASGKYETLAPMKQITSPGNHSIYGIASDSKNNLWFMEFQDNYIGKQDRHVRHQGRKLQGMEAADSVVRPLLSGRRPEWRGLDRRHDHRSRDAARPEDQSNGRILPAQGHQHPSRLRGQHHDAGDVLDRQQSRRLHRQGRAAGLRRINPARRRRSKGVAARFALRH